MKLYVYKNDQQLGPFDETQIAEGLNSGYFTAHDLAWHDGLSEWKQLGELLKNPETPPPLPTNPQLENPSIIQTNVQQGAMIGGWVCFALGIVTMYLSMWTFFIYGPLFLAAFILSILAMAQKRIAGGIILLLATILIPSLMGLFLFTFRTTQAVAKVLGVENNQPAKPSNPKNDELDNKNGFRNLILGSQYDSLKDLIEVDNGFIVNLLKSKDDESKRYVLKDKGENIGDAEIDEIVLIFNQNILSKISVKVKGKQNTLILRESLIKAYGEPFADSKKISSWYGAKTSLELIMAENPDSATAEYTNKEINDKIQKIISNNTLIKNEEIRKQDDDLKKKAKENADEGSKSL